MCVCVLYVGETNSVPKEEADFSQSSPLVGGSAQRGARTVANKPPDLLPVQGNNTAYVIFSHTSLSPPPLFSP